MRGPPKSTNDDRGTGVSGNPSCDLRRMRRASIRPSSRFDGIAAQCMLHCMRQFKNTRLARMSSGHYCVIRDLGLVKGGKGLRHHEVVLDLTWRGLVQFARSALRAQAGWHQGLARGLRAGGRRRAGAGAPGTRARRGARRGRIRPRLRPSRRRGRRVAGPRASFSSASAWRSASFLAAQTFNTSSRMTCDGALSAWSVTSWTRACVTAWGTG